MKTTLTLFFALFLSFSWCSSSAQQWGDYTLYATQNGTTALLVDTTGATYHTWTFSSSAKTGYSTYMLPGGTLVRTIAKTNNQLNGGGMTGGVQKVDYNGNVLWDYTYSTASYCLHHDICPMPNGNVLMISYEVKSSTEVTAAGSSTSHTMWPDKIIEVQPTGATTGTIVWEWHVWDHLCQSVDATKANYVSAVSDHPELLNINYNNTSQTTDWMHVNGVDYNESLDQIVFSSHMLNELYVIDHSTTTAEAASHSGGNGGRGGDFLYRWGNPAAYAATGTNVYHTVHDAHFVSEGPQAGNLVVFNNNGVSNSVSSIDQVTPPYNGYNYDYAAGTSYSPSTYTMRHNCNGHSNNMGNSQQLPNGNALVCVAQSGLIYEIDPAGNNIWQHQVNGTVAQAFRYSACYLYGGTPAAPTISENGNVLTSSVGSEYQWYLNGTPISQSTSSSSFTPTAIGNYQVQIIEAGNCPSALSEAVVITALGVDELEFKQVINLYPNPTNGKVTIAGTNVFDGAFNVSVTDNTGRKIHSSSNLNVIDVALWENGIYYVTILSNGAVVTKTLSVIK